MTLSNVSGSQNVTFSNGSDLNTTFSNSSSITACNESLKHDNEQKAIFHGMKSAFRMSRKYDGNEYGSHNPQHETAARIAANVAIAHLDANDVEYDREESMEYLQNEIIGSITDRIVGLFGIRNVDISREDLEDGIERAWKQIDEKEHHDDGARTALAIAEAYLGIEFYE